MSTINSIVERVNEEIRRRDQPENGYEITNDGLRRLKARLANIDSILHSLQWKYGDDLGFSRGVNLAIDLVKEREKLLAREAVINAYLADRAS